MIEIKPNIQIDSTCPQSGTILKPKSIIWQGMHVCAVCDAQGSKTEIIDDLKVGHSRNNPSQIDLEKGLVFGKDGAKEWLGNQLLKSLQYPNREEIEISKEVFKPSKQVIILNCIDYLYGHSLLKLLNAQRHLEQQPDYGLVVIVPKFLRWLVPDGVAEVWTVGISLKNGRCYYPSFDEFVREECSRFEKIYLSEAYSHPSQFDISKFTRVTRHNFDTEDFRITFVWREDRLWCSMLLFRFLRKFKLIERSLFLQNWKVRKLLSGIREKVPSAKFAIAGLGRKTQFPEWIEDFRVDRYNEKTEKEACQLYSESRIVIGVHGSNMLLPSGQAGMSIDLMPEKRWGNFAQDILYQETDPRLASFRYRYLPVETSIGELADLATSMILKRLDFQKNMMADKL